jgi:hypothetical protein
MSNQRKLLSRQILIIAALVSVVASAAYACPGVVHPLRDSLCRQISLAGVPGILIAAAVSMTLLGGVHGGGPLTVLLVIATPVNFVLYVGLGVAARAVWRLVTKMSAGSTDQ